jgi:ankyrin repeat protein
MACKERDFEEFIVALLAAGADPNHVNPIRNKASLHVATEHGNYAAIAALLQESRTDVNILDNFGCTALHIAAKHFMKNIDDMERCISVLMAKPNIKINQHNTKNRTAVHEALLGNCKLADEALLKYGKFMLLLKSEDIQRNL